MNGGKASEKRTLQIYSFHFVCILLSIKTRRRAGESGVRVEYWDPIILQLLIIKSFAKLATERQNYWTILTSVFRFISWDINCTMIDIVKSAKQHDDLLKPNATFSPQNECHKTHSFLVAIRKNTRQCCKKYETSTMSVFLLLH